MLVEDFCYNCEEYTEHEGDNKLFCTVCEERNYVAESSAQCECEACDCAHEVICTEACDCKDCEENGCCEE